MIFQKIVLLKVGLAGGSGTNVLKHATMEHRCHPGSACLELPEMEDATGVVHEPKLVTSRLVTVRVKI